MFISQDDLTGGPRSSTPLPRPCLSYWQRTTRAFPHLNAKKDSPVPASKPCVIIGSGISGALTAFELTESGVEGQDIVILEAREAASGASSRNAGHVRPGKTDIRDVLATSNFLCTECVQMPFEDLTTIQTSMG